MQAISSLAEIADRYDAVFCDLWGCLHNGVTPYPAAVAALQGFRARGGQVVLLTNAPRPAAAVAAHLAKMGVPREAWDVIMSSGEAARHALRRGDWGRKLCHVGPERDKPTYEGLDVQIVPLAEAEAILCTGLFDDEVETPEDYRALVQAGVARGLRMLCANPDVVVDRGETRLYCAGAIAELYQQQGGQVVHTGKPWPVIYEAALALSGANPKRVLAIGDGPSTDIRGARLAGLDALFISGGLGAHAIGGDVENPDPLRAQDWLSRQGESAKWLLGRLR